MSRDPRVIENISEFQERYLWVPPEPGRQFLVSLNGPAFAPAHQATHMRDDDYVVGLVYGDSARAYPLWIVDYYHGINDHVQDEPLIVFS